MMQSTGCWLAARYHHSDAFFNLNMNSKMGFTMLLAIWFCYVNQSAQFNSQNSKRQTEIPALYDGAWCTWQAWSCESPRFPNVHKRQECHTVRYRECNCPAPLGRHAQMCPGDSLDITSQPDTAFQNLCRKNWDCKQSQRNSQDAPWCPWSAWSHWDATCGNMSRTRVRQCNCVTSSSSVTCISKIASLHNTQRGNGFETHQQFHYLSCPKDLEPNWCQWSAWESCDCARGSRERRRTCKCPYVPNKFCGQELAYSTVLISPCVCELELTSEVRSTRNPTHKAKIQFEDSIHESESTERFKRNFVIAVSIIVTCILSAMLFLIGRGIFRTWKRCTRSHGTTGNSDGGSSGLIQPNGQRWGLRSQRRLGSEPANRVPLTASLQTKSMSQGNIVWCNSQSNSHHNLQHESNQIL